MANALWADGAVAVVAVADAVEDCILSVRDFIVVVCVCLRVYLRCERAFNNKLLYTQRACVIFCDA